MLIKQILVLTEHGIFIPAGHAKRTFSKTNKMAACLTKENVTNTRVKKSLQQKSRLRFINNTDNQHILMSIHYFTTILYVKLSHKKTAKHK